MKQKFTLSKSNKIYFGVVAVISLVLFLVFASKASYQVGGEQIGELTGRLIGFLIFPSLFSWIVWRLSGRKENGGSLTFNIFLTLIVLGQVGQFGNKLQQSQQLQEIQEQKEEFKKKVSNTDDPGEWDAAYEEYVDSIQDGFSKLSAASTGQEKQFFRIMHDYVSEFQSTEQNWIESYDAVMSPRILDFSVLNDDEEFNYQINILIRYVEETKVYNEAMVNKMPILKKRLSVLGEKNEYAVGAIKGASNIHNLQMPIFEPLIQAHIEYGSNMIQVLELLQKNKNEWSYENDEMLIYSDDVLTKFNELFEVLGTNEESINELSTKLIETI